MEEPRGVENEMRTGRCAMLFMNAVLLDTEVGLDSETGGVSWGGAAKWLRGRIIFC